MASSDIPAIATVASLKEKFGRVLESALLTGADQLSELQRERLTHPLEVPEVLKSMCLRCRDMSGCLGDVSGLYLKLGLDHCVFYYCSSFSLLFPLILNLGLCIRI